MTTSTPQPGPSLGTPGQADADPDTVDLPTAPVDAVVDEPDEPTTEVAVVDEPATEVEATDDAVTETAATGEPATENAADDDEPVGDEPVGDWSELIWRVGFPVAMALLVLAIPVLVLAGRAVVLGSTDGELVERVTDPSAPGWEAVAEPTPTMLILQTDADDRLVGVTVLSLTGPESAGVLLVPIGTLTTDRLQTLAELAAKEPEGVKPAVESLLGAGMIDVATVGPAGWSGIVAPAGPITFTNPDDIFGPVPEGGRAPLLFPKGTVTVSAEDAPAYLAGRSPNESDLNRMVRHTNFWKAWLDRVREGGADAIPGERESGLGRFVAELAVDRLEVETLPVRKAEASPANGGAERFVAVVDRSRALVARLIPFPVGSPPGFRARVRLLDGVGTLRNGLVAAPAVVGAGAEIVQIGNAPAFGVATTRVAYGSDERRGEAEAIARALGGGEIVKQDEIGGGTDVVITLGRDYAGRPVSTTTAGSVPPATSGGT